MLINQTNRTAIDWLEASRLYERCRIDDDLGNTFTFLIWSSRVEEELVILSLASAFSPSLPPDLSRLFVDHYRTQFKEFWSCLV
jgi:hypothetical protein